MLVHYQHLPLHFFTLYDKNINKVSDCKCCTIRLGLLPGEQLANQELSLSHLPAFPQILLQEQYCKLLSLDYLVHDYETICRNLKPTSRRVLFDLGATLDLRQDLRMNARSLVLDLLIFIHLRLHPRIQQIFYKNCTRQVLCCISLD